MPAGYGIVRELFATCPSQTVEGIVLWIPMLPSDDAAAAAVQADVWPGNRVQHWWDGAWEMSRLFQRSLGLREPAWDVYLLYRPGIRWEGEAPPAPSFWMHQASDAGADPDLLLCGDPLRLVREFDRLIPE